MNHLLDVVIMTNNPQDVNDVFPYGSALETRGLANISAINGYGLVTFGFLWQGHSIWGPDSGISLTTTWTDSANNLFGEYPQRL